MSDQVDIATRNAEHFTALGYLAGLKKALELIKKDRLVGNAIQRIENEISKTFDK